MRKILTAFFIFLTLFGQVVLGQVVASEADIGVRHRKKHIKPDSVAQLAVRDLGKAVRSTMSTSHRPVQMQVVGRVLKVHSPENQMLPIYTSSGTFYIVMRLNKGTNWLSGLPRGKYLINNRQIIIN